MSGVVTKEDQMQSEYLGRTVTDEISGFNGVVVGHVVYLTGCHQLLVQPKYSGTGEFVDSRWFDVDRCAIVGDSIVHLTRTTSGSDKPAPRR